MTLFNQTHIGMAFMTNSIAALAGPPALGAIITATGEYWQGELDKGKFSVSLSLTLYEKVETQR